MIENSLYNPWPKGSEWRKWDLHVHTPASYHWNGGKILRNMNEDEKRDAFRHLLDVIEESDVAVFCFVDYWTIDGYIQFEKYLKENDLPCSKTIFPGIELRVEAPVDYRLNAQVILSNALSFQQLNDFKSNLIIGATSRQLSDEAIIDAARKLDTSKAKEQGYDDPEHISENDLFLLGSRTIKITRESLKAAIEAIPSGHSFIVMPFDTSGGLSDLDWKTHPHDDNYFMQIADIIESRREETIELFNGIETEKNKHFIKDFLKTIGNNPKPVICGSDAHRFSDYGKFPSNNDTWIKANPSFNGLRQIIYEPVDRVLIQDLPPEDKTPYLVIDKVRFIDETGLAIFPTTWIEFNENLNTIIGGKSSGKSLLMHFIANSIAPELVEKRRKEVHILDYKFGAPGELDFEVMWKDEQVDKLSTSPEYKKREIEYIPQMYVNKLAEEEGKPSLYNLINSILEQNSEYAKFIYQVRKDISELEIEIDKNVAALLKLRNDVEKLQSELREIGELNAINDEINRLFSQISDLRDESGFSEEDEIKYKALLSRRQKQIHRQQKYEKLRRNIQYQADSMRRISDKIFDELKLPPVNLGMDNFSSRIIQLMLNGAIEIIRKSFTVVIDSHHKLSVSVQKKEDSIRKSLNRINAVLKPYNAKIANQNLLQRLTSKYDEQQNKLSTYNAKVTEINTITDVGLQTRKGLFDCYSSLLDCYERIVQELQKDEYYQIDKEIVLETSLEFNIDRFDSTFSDLLFRNQNFQQIFESGFDVSNNFQFEKDSHLDNIRSIFDTLSKKALVKEIRFKKSATSSDAISALLKNYFVVDYNLRYKDDDILEMSPGKRGLVLLQLILHISNAKHPILIDQPEDNLDNRTISNELKNFIKKKKLTRQIIMVTHDANLVVLTDAENIIASNQSGQLVDRENKEFRFEYVTGSLEYSFPELDDESTGILYSCGIREHVCDILEGGEEAFLKREQKYGFSDYR